MKPSDVRGCLHSSIDLILSWIPVRSPERSSSCAGDPYLTVVSLAPATFVQSVQCAATWYRMSEHRGKEYLLTALFVH